MRLGVRTGNLLPIGVDRVLGTLRCPTEKGTPEASAELSACFAADAVTSLGMRFRGERGIPLLRVVLDAELAGLIRGLPSETVRREAEMRSLGATTDKGRMDCAVYWFLRLVGEAGACRRDGSYAVDALGDRLPSDVAS